MIQKKKINQYEKTKNTSWTILLNTILSKFKKNRRL